MNLPTWHDDALGLIVPNRYYHDAFIDEYVTVADMADGGLAGGYCAWVSEEIIDSAQGADNCDYVQVIPVDEDKAEVNYHVAVFDHETDLVYDYTMRQFDYDLPFPYVGTVESWHEVIEQTTKQSWTLEVPDSVSFKLA